MILPTAGAHRGLLPRGVLAVSTSLPCTSLWRANRNRRGSTAKPPRCGSGTRRTSAGGHWRWRDHAAPMVGGSRRLRKADYFDEDRITVNIIVVILKLVVISVIFFVAFMLARFVWLF